MEKYSRIFLCVCIALMLAVGCSPANDKPDVLEPIETIAPVAEPTPSPTPVITPAPVITPTPTPVRREPEGTGSATASATGFGGKITLTVTVKDGVITEFVVESNNETQGIGSRAIEELPDSILDANSLSMDGVSGATMTSNAIFDAAEKALSEIAEK